MTTIAVRDGVMAADSKIASGDDCGTTCKLYRIRGVIIGFSGGDRNGKLFLRWYAGRHFYTPQFFTGDDDDCFEALLLTKRKLELWDESLIPSRVKAPFYAIGSGRGVAMGAMAAGASAEEAVHIACRYSVLTGPPVVVASPDR